MDTSTAKHQKRTSVTLDYDEQRYHTVSR